MIEDRGGSEENQTCVVDMINSGLFESPDTLHEFEKRKKTLNESLQIIGFQTDIL